MAPPTGWKFAHAPAATFASVPDAMIAVTTFDRQNKSRSREAVVRELAEHVGVTLPARKDILPRKPHKRQPIGAITLSFYQFERVRRSQHHGVMLVFTTDLPSTEALLGVAFVASDDRNKGDQAVLRAIESLTPPDVAAPTTEHAPTAKLRSSEPAAEPAPAEKENYGLDLRKLK
ncbi:MAG TPA: hypothetical protein VJT73_14675 [Polyangiaceae bacterium]|nr:hypothetical protein [Polyangiaceae bacterium]